MSKAFEAIKAGLEDALAHLEGKKTGGRLRRVYVPNIDVAATRARLGLSQGDFAAAFGVSAATVRNWEQGRRRPDGPARVLLAVVDREPEAVLRALEMPRREPKTAPRSGVRGARRRVG
jgi:putative transcriptional regulator